MAKNEEEILETVEKTVEEKEVNKEEKKQDKKEEKKAKKVKKDPANELDEILYGKGERKKDTIDMGEVPEFMNIGKKEKSKKEKKEEIPEYLRY